jgi:4-amino-4-deoxy-L-arabinose transferase-like glycosyltransferase
MSRLSVVLPLVLHVAVFAGLYQTGYTPEEWEQIGSLDRAKGTLSPLRWYFRTGGDELDYLEYTRLVLKGQMDYERVFKTRGLPVPSPPARAWPYRDVRLEYPPLYLLFILPPGLLASELGYSSYRLALGVWLCLLHIVNLLLAWRLFRRIDTEPPAQSQLVRLLWWSLAFCLCMGNIVVLRLDHAVVSCSLLALLAFKRSMGCEGRPRLMWAGWCGVAIAVGMMTKIVPGVLLPAVLMVYRTVDGSSWWRRGALACVLGFATTLLLINAASVWVFGPLYWQTFAYHLDRGVQIESLYAGVLLIAHLFGFAVKVEGSYGSINLVSSATAAVRVLSPLIMLASAGCIIWWSRGQRHAGAPKPERWQQAGVLSIAWLVAFILANKVFSPQFLIWLEAPLLAFVATRSGERPLGYLLLISAALSQVLFPRAYYLLEEQLLPVLIAVLNLRNGLVIALFACLLRRLRNMVGRGLAFRFPPPIDQQQQRGQRYDGAR